MSLEASGSTPHRHQKLAGLDRFHSARECKCTRVVPVSCRVSLGYQLETSRYRKPYCMVTPHWASVRAHLTVTTLSVPE
ncbi:hypothetical protein J6590_028023 [Homalodisca vitripennis]|nr:hypothetical protein J6590_028023 [Homalodisca vitripennis]